MICEYASIRGSPRIRRGVRARVRRKKPRSLECLQHGKYLSGQPRNLSLAATLNFSLVVYSLCARRRRPRRDTHIYKCIHFNLARVGPDLFAYFSKVLIRNELC